MLTLLNFSLLVTKVFKINLLSMAFKTKIQDIFASPIDLINTSREVIVVIKGQLF